MKKQGTFKDTYNENKDSKDRDPKVRYYFILSILNTTGLKPSVQEAIITLSSFIHPWNISWEKFPPVERAVTNLKISFHAHSQKSAGFSRPSTRNSWPSSKQGHGIISPGQYSLARSSFKILFKTVILQLDSLNPPCSLIH